MSDQLDEFSTETGCPKCGSKIVSKVKYTWWGGVLGPRLLHHTKCETCGYRFNSKTRNSNTKAIVLYSIITFGIIFLLYYFLRKM